MELLSIPAIVALVEALKYAGFPDRFIPLSAIGIGAAFGLGIGTLVGGLVLGLAASGLYSGAKRILEG